MEFTNEFTVPAPTAEAWKLLTDVPRIAPCLPGATVEPLDDGTYSGTVSVKVGPIKARYRGTASFRELDPSALRMVLDAQGSESGGKGSASGAATVQLSDQGGQNTLVKVTTELRITGKVAQFGRSAMVDIAAGLIDQFARNLEALLGADQDNTPGPGADTPVGQGTAGAAAAPADPKVQQETAAEDELDVTALLGPVLKRVFPQIAAFAAGAATAWLISRRTPRVRGGNVGQS